MRTYIQKDYLPADSMSVALQSSKTEIPSFPFHNTRQESNFNTNDLRCRGAEWSRNIDAWGHFKIPGSHKFPYK